MSEQYFFVRTLGLGKEVVSLSLVVTEVSRAGDICKDYLATTLKITASF